MEKKNPPSPRKNSAVAEFSIDGMTCGNCARHVSDAIQSVPEIQSAFVSLKNKTATARWKSSEIKNIAAVLLAVKNAGYEAKEISTGNFAGEHKHKNWRANLWLGIFVTIFLMTGEWVFGLGEIKWFRWLAFFLAGAVQIFSGAPFYRGAWRQLKIGGSNMDTLVALGSTTAFGFSCWVLFGGGGKIYFMESAAIITLISLGHWLEARVSDKAGGALKSLLNLAPQTANRLKFSSSRGDEALTKKTENGNRKSEMDQRFLTSSPANEETVSVSELKIGDEIILRPGDRVPVDGIIIDGESAIDESMLTGESVPLDKGTGGELFAGTVNLNGRLNARVTATGESTALAHVIAAVQRAQTSRADIQRLGDRVSSVFVPIVVVIAIAAGLCWGIFPESAKHFHDWLAQFLWMATPPIGIAAAFIVAAAVLIVACPCAMGLATPAAIMAGANAAARRGILIRDGVALERAGKVTAVIFDKTGTLTFGKPEVAAQTEFRIQNSEARILAAALAHNSTHPVSQAIAKISSEKMELENWKEIRGGGVEAQISNSEIARLGSMSWLKESGVDFADGEKFISDWSNQGATIIGLAAGKNLLALFAVRDSLKPAAANVVQKLQRRNLKIFLVTGDNSLTAASIAKQVGIAAENIFAEIRPEQKAEFVKKLQARGERVAFVGDGINDAPALTQADLGIVVSRASDIAREAADIILLKSEIEAVPESLDLARATLRTIKQNLFWAFFYNAIGVPLAAMGFISPVLCAAAMGFSDLIVIGNALRLLRFSSAARK